MSKSDYVSRSGHEIGHGRKIIYHVWGSVIKAITGIGTGILASRAAKKNAERARKERNIEVAAGRKNIEGEREKGFEMRKKHGGDYDSARGKRSVGGDTKMAKTMDEPPVKRKQPRTTEMV